METRDALEQDLDLKISGLAEEEVDECDVGRSRGLGRGWDFCIA